MGLTKIQQCYPPPHGKRPGRRADSGRCEFCNVGVVGSCITGEWKRLSCLVHPLLNASSHSPLKGAPGKYAKNQQTREQLRVGPGGSEHYAASCPIGQPFNHWAPVTKTLDLFISVPLIQNVVGTTICIHGSFCRTGGQEGVGDKCGTDGWFQSFIECS